MSYYTSLILFPVQITAWKVNKGHLTLARSSDMDSWSLAVPFGGCELAQQSTVAPKAGSFCLAVGSVAWNMDSWSEDSSDWLIYCNENRVWSPVNEAKSKSQWEALGDAWIRLDVDTANNESNLPDDPVSWLNGNVTGIPKLDRKCQDAEPSGYEYGGALHICVNAMTNHREYAATICSGGVINDTPACGGSLVLDSAGLIGSDDCPLTVGPNHWALAVPFSGCELAQQSSVAPSEGDFCYFEGTVAWDMEKWFDDRADWLLYCNDNRVWSVLTGGKKKSIWESESKAWIRLDVDTTNVDGNSPDDPPSWLKGTVSGMAKLNQKCNNAEPSGYVHGGGLHICVNAMTNHRRFVATICSKGAASDTPTCGGNVVLDTNGLIGSADCPETAVENDPWALADPSGDCELAQQPAAAPILGTSCSSAGSVVWNMASWNNDQSNWLMFCTQANVWSLVMGGKKKSLWEAENKPWIRLDVDTENKAGNTLDSPTAWLKGSATGLSELNSKCDDAEPSGWRFGGSLYICASAMTNLSKFVAMICSRGVSNDTPNCGGHAVLDTDGLIGSDNCPKSEQIDPWAIADPSGGCELAVQTTPAPALGTACSTIGSVSWNLAKWNDDQSDWLLYCSQTNEWSLVMGGKKKSLWETEGKTWIRLDVDTGNKVDNTPDSPAAWLKGSATGLNVLNKRCNDAEPSGWSQGGSLHICANAMTNYKFAATICSKGVSNDTPNCGGNVILDTDGLIGSDECPEIIENDPWALANPTAGACTLMQQSTSAPAPNVGNPCTVSGSVSWNMASWNNDQADWLLYCTAEDVWTRVMEAKKRTILESEGRKWIRLNVDAANKNNVPTTPDSPISWLMGSATGLATLNSKCDDPEPSGWRFGGSLHICLDAMTVHNKFVAIICSRGVAEDTPNCGGPVVLDEDGYISTSSTVCPLNF